MNSVTKMKITAHFFTFRYVFFLFVVCRPNLDLKLYRIVNILVDRTKKNTNFSELLGMRTCIGGGV